MSDWIEHDGKKYFEESYFGLVDYRARKARLAAARECAEIAEAHLHSDIPIIPLSWDEIARVIREKFELEKGDENA